MNFTTDGKSVRTSTVLLISIALQTIGVLIFYSVDAFRLTRLKADTADVRSATREAEQRLKELEVGIEKKRETANLKPDDARKLVENEVKKNTGQILDKLHKMKEIRENLEGVATNALLELANREASDIGTHFYNQIHPLSTQLMINANRQNEEIRLAASPDVKDASETFLVIIEKEKENLVDPGIFNQLRVNHRNVQEYQHQFILQLDDAQKGYAENEERIRRENHTEYLVNLMRDQIAELLGNIEAFDLSSMNELPAGFELPPEPSPDWEQLLDTMTVPELHAASTSLYNDIQDLFRAAQAATIAVSEHTSFTNAFTDMNISSPPTSFQPGNLPNPPQTVGELAVYADGLHQAAKDVNQMWQSSFNMARAGKALADQGSTPGSPGGSNKGNSSSKPGRSASASQAASGQLGRYADMTPFMYRSGSDGNANVGGSIGGGSDVIHKGKRTGYRESGMGMEEGSKVAPLLSESKVLKEALPGRKFSRNSKRTGWLYIDTWYVIGPWENLGRINFTKTLPPETLVDLDATYIGKNNQTIVWQFHQSDNIRIKPPNEQEQSTYYGYTEVYFEEQTDMLVAIASDDVAKVWLNGLVIWQDSGLSPWRLDEGFRKVTFRAGFNTILLRIENGPITCTFSLLLCPPEAIALK